MPADTALHLDPGADFANAPFALYAFPARGWNRQEYAALQASPVGASLAVVTESSEKDWAGTQVQALAARYAERIAAEESQKQRPVALLGWSVGGLVALELTHQLNQIAGRIQNPVRVAWVGLVDASTFPQLRAQLATAPALTAAQRDELGTVASAWMERSSMREAWRAAVQHMGTAQRDLFLREVVAAYGPHLPTDGPAPSSQEHQLWTRLNCLRLGLGWEPPAQAPASLRWWSSAEMAADTSLRGHFHGQVRSGAVQVMEGTDHLKVLETKAWHEAVAAAVAEGSAG